MSFLSTLLSERTMRAPEILKTALNTIYPPQCMACSVLVETEQAFCGGCWKDVSFIHGLACDKCGAPLQGDEMDEAPCDGCMSTVRPWRQGYAALLYSGTGRRMVMALKHGDRTELAVPAAKWLAAKVRHLGRETTVIPVPLHRKRFLKRKYNQSALIARALADELDVEFAPSALRRIVHTDSLDNKNTDSRYKTLTNAISSNPDYSLSGRSILLVDDVMTSGATLTACAEACVAAGARHVDIAVLARVAKDS